MTSLITSEARGEVQLSARSLTTPHEADQGRREDERDRQSLRVEVAAAKLSILEGEEGGREARDAGDDGLGNGVLGGSTLEDNGPGRVRLRLGAGRESVDGEGFRERGKDHEGNDAARNGGRLCLCLGGRGREREQGEQRRHESGGEMHLGRSIPVSDSSRYFVAVCL